jgi:hypothetical protein
MIDLSLHLARAFLLIPNQRLEHSSAFGAECKS